MAHEEAIEAAKELAEEHDGITFVDDPAVGVHSKEVVMEGGGSVPYEAQKLVKDHGWLISDFSAHVPRLILFL